MTDQYGNNVDGEIWIDQVVRYGAKDGSQKPALEETESEYAIAYCDGVVDSPIFDEKGDALAELRVMRRRLKQCRVPEEHHPILMQREVTTTYGSWKPMDV